MHEATRAENVAGCAKRRGAGGGKLVIEWRPGKTLRKTTLQWQRSPKIRYLWCRRRGKKKLASVHYNTNWHISTIPMRWQSQKKHKTYEPEALPTQIPSRLATGIRFGLWVSSQVFYCLTIASDLGFTPSNPQPLRGCHELRSPGTGRGRFWTPGRWSSWSSNRSCRSSPGDEGFGKAGGGVGVFFCLRGSYFFPLDFMLDFLLGGFWMSDWCISSWGRPLWFFGVVSGWLLVEWCWYPAAGVLPRERSHVFLKTNKSPEKTAPLRWKPSRWQ